MTTLIQLTTRRYLPDGSPKPHYIATGGRRPVQQPIGFYNITHRCRKPEYDDYSYCLIGTHDWEHFKASGDIAVLREQEPVHWRAVLDKDQVPQQLNPDLHVVGFRQFKAAESWTASRLDFDGWRYAIEPLYALPLPPVEQADSKQISVSNIIDAIQLAKIAYFEGAPALEVFVQIMGHAPCSSCGYHNAHCRCNKAIFAEQIEPFNTLHPEVAAKDARIAELEKQLESYGALLLHVRKALCGDIHNEQDLLGLIAANTARVKVEALHNFAEDYGGGKYGLMNCFDALKQYADQIAKEAQS